jgi:hypothetical protein
MEKLIQSNTLANTILDQISFIIGYNGWASGSHFNTKPTVAIQITELGEGVGPGCIQLHPLFHFKWRM